MNCLLAKLKEEKRRISILAVFFAVLAALLILLLAGLTGYKTALARLKKLELERISGQERLKSTYLIKYRDILRQKNKTASSYLVNSFINCLPDGYKIESISVKKISGANYRFEAILYWQAGNRYSTNLRLPRIFRAAKQEEILVRGSPGIRVTLDF